ncbi:serine-rich adhesin for platelets-like isoform X2 [Dermacentor albipictus]|uniref:serine-rich adhesin for platelets-like isoform X2 n=1 Tax=Dermacentor albipictus TaxID=60249 RepID=UPI0038FCDBF0
MLTHARKELSLDAQGGGSLDASRLTLRPAAPLDLVDAGTQVDLSADTIAYDSDDDMMKRKISALRSRKGHPIYSREDIREQYCITRKEIAVLDDKGATARSLFGCLAAQGATGGGGGSPCNAALFSCVQRASSDENIPPPPPATQSGGAKDDDDDFASSGFRRRPKPFCLQDPKLRFSNLDAADSDSVRVVVHSRSFSARPRLQSCNSYGSTSQGSLASSSNLSYVSRCASRPSNLSFQYEGVTLGQCHSVDALNDASTWRRRSDGGVAVPDALLDDRRPKHVSFDSNALVRSNTVAGGLEDVELSLGGPAATSTPLGRRAVSTPDGSQERLLDARHYQDSFERASFGRRRALVKTQATQTESVYNRTKASLPAYLTLSPRAARGAKHKAARRRKAKDARRAGTSVSDDSDEDVMEVDLVSKQQRLLPSPKPHKHGKAKQDSLMTNKFEDGEAKSPRTKDHMEELSRALCKIDLLREARSSARPAPVGHEDAVLNSRRDLGSNCHSGPRVEHQSNAKQYPSKESSRRDEKRSIHPAQPEGLTSPESESSSSQFTERESSRSERSTSSSGPAVAAKLRDANADAGRQDTTSESTSEYVTATEHSAKIRESTETSSTSQARRDGTDTSFETASSASLFSSPSSRNGARTKTPSPKASSRDVTRDPDEAAMSSEETEKGHNDSSDESTKKEEQVLSSESGEYSLGRAEGVDDEDEDRTDKSDDEQGALERDADSIPASQADEFSECAAPPHQPPDLMRTSFFDQGGPCSSRNDEDTDDMETIMMPLMTFRDVQNAISRSEIRQYDELSTVSEVSEENSNSDQQITERYQPPVPDAISKPETPPPPLPPLPPPTEERQPLEGRAALEQRPPSEGRPPPLEQPASSGETESQERPAATERLTPLSPDQPKEPFHYSSSEYLDSEVTTPSFDSATTSCSFNMDLPPSAAAETSLETTSHASNLSTTPTDSDSKSAAVVEGEPTRNDDTDVTDSSTSTQITTRRRPPEAPRQQPDGGGAIPKLQGIVGGVGSTDHRRRRERASRVRWEILDAACSAQVATSAEDIWMRHRDLGGRRSRSLPRSPESRGLDSVMCSQCGDKVREHRVPGLYSWERPLTRGHCLDGRRSAPCPDYGHVRMPAPYPAADFYDDDEDDEDAGIHSRSYRQTSWLYITREHEMLAWKQHLRGNSRRTRKESSSSSVLSDSSPSSSSSSSPAQSRSSSPESTESEREFRRQYVTLTHRMIHRKASLEMYRRMAHRCFEATKTVRIEKSNGEFGFRIHGSHPVVVSAIEKGTPAQSCGLEVGDIIISINGISVLEASHTEVVRIAHAGTEVLVMELARTCHVLTPKVKEHPPIMWGYLQRLSSGGRSKRWCRRWFVLKPDNRLYWYKNERDYDVVGAVMLEAVSVGRVVEAGAEHAFKVVKSPGTTSNSNAIYFAADDEEAAGRWISALNQVACIASRGASYMDTVVSNMHSPCGSLADPDCQGYLCKLSQQWKSWKKRFLVLKDACLYFYKDRNAPVAVGAFLLHGYRVQSCSMTGKKNTFEAIPPEPLMRHLRFLADTEYEKKRWLASMEYSIDRWIKV